MGRSSDVLSVRVGRCGWVLAVDTSERWCGRVLLCVDGQLHQEENKVWGDLVLLHTRNSILQGESSSTRLEAIRHRVRISIGDTNRSEKLDEATRSPTWRKRRDQSVPTMPYILCGLDLSQQSQALSRAGHGAPRLRKHLQWTTTAYHAKHRRR